MTLSRTNIQVRRLQVRRGAMLAYDESFHPGVNVIRGENSAGKSTVLNALYYALGGDLTRWSDAALLCDQVVIEVSLNGKIATLSREITKKPNQPMEIFGGDLESSLISPRSEWLRYPYSRGQKESFSQVLFRLLEIPEAANDASGNITMHQLLRLVYSDQLSSIEELFRSDPFDSENIRNSVGRLLCGAFDDELYSNELTIRQLEKDFRDKASELSSVLKVLGRAAHGLTPEWLVAERASLLAERQTLLARIDEARSDQTSTGGKATLDQGRAAFERLKDAQMKLSAAREDIERVNFEISDSALFIRSLSAKQEAVRDADAVATAFGDVRYSHCPSCHEALTVAADGHCHLCRMPFDTERAQKRIVAVINDIAIQLRQSNYLQDERRIELARLEEVRKSLEQLWQVAAAGYASVRSTPTDDAQARLGDLQRQLGYLDRKLEELDGRGRMIEDVARLSADKERIQSSISSLTTRNEILRANQSERLGIAYHAIAEEALWFVSNDLVREEAFDRPKHVDFNFSKNKIAVDGQEYFSASSRVILKNSFIAGFLFAAIKNEFFRHPRIIIIDTMEDKGMEPVRSQNFQNLLLERSRDTAVEHQIIFATSMISPELDSEDMTIGHFATRDNPTLAIATSH